MLQMASGLCAPFHCYMQRGGNLCRDWISKVCMRVLPAAQVALLFLVRGTIHHERTWASWLGDAGELVPSQVAAAECCGDSVSGEHWLPESPSSEHRQNAAAGNDTVADGGSGSSGGGAASTSDGKADCASSNSTQCATANAATRRRRSRRQLREDAQPPQGGWWPRKRRRRNSKGVVQAQQLFNVYVHPAPGFEYSSDHLFYGREVSDRVQVQLS